MPHVFALECERLPVVGRKPSTGVLPSFSICFPDPDLVVESNNANVENGLRANVSQSGRRHAAYEVLEQFVAAEYARKRGCGNAFERSLTQRLEVCGAHFHLENF